MKLGKEQRGEPAGFSSQRLDSRAIPPCGDAGTARAIYPYPSSVRPIEGLAQAGRGGARLRADRVSDGVTTQHAANILHAAAFATKIGLPLNRHITIHWDCIGVTDARAALAIGVFLRLLRDWLRKRGHNTAWAWVRENGDGKGSHVHILAHIPPSVRWLPARSRRWLKRISGADYVGGTIRTTRVGGTTNAALLSPALHATNLERVVAYILKGANPEAAEALGLTRLDAGGHIVGKRSGVSQNIGKTARVRSSVK